MSPNKVQIVSCTAEAFVKKHKGRKPLQIRKNTSTYSYQITIPVHIRKKLNLKTRDKIIFENDENGNLFYMKG